MIEGETRTKGMRGKGTWNKERTDLGLRGWGRTLRDGKMGGKEVGGG